jgi:biofilm protein TabA
MVLDALANAPQYHALGPQLAQALQYLRTTDLAAVPLGRHEIDGSRVFVLVQDYTTMPLEDGLWEAHRKHIDVQYVQKGEERVRYANLATLKAAPYDDEKDLLRAEGPGELFLLKPDRFVILFPQDAHSPGLMSDRRQHVRKIVIKVAIGEIQEFRNSGT